MVHRVRREPQEVPVVQCGVAGHPVGHSLSPAIHRAAYAALGFDWGYDAYDLTPDEFGPFVESRKLPFRGLSVTMPHKEPAARLGIGDPDVRLTGVANTLIWDIDDRRRAYNTDIPGLVDALRLAGITRPRTASVLGTGATAVSAVVACLRLGVRTVQVLGRSPDKASALAARASSLGLEAVAAPWPGPLDPHSELLLSTVPADAVAAQVDELRLAGPSSLRAVFDVIYHPWPTVLADEAHLAGLSVLSGLDLLVHQAAHQVRLMTGRDVEVQTLASAARAELRRRVDA